MFLICFAVLESNGALSLSIAAAAVVLLVFLVLLYFNKRWFSNGNINCCDDHFTLPHTTRQCCKCFFLLPLIVFDYISIYNELLVYLCIFFIIYSE